MPMKEVKGLKIPPARQNQLLKEVNSFFRKIMNRYYVNPIIFPPMKHKFTAVYSRDKEYLFDINTPDFFTPATRSRIVQFILDRTRFTIDKEDDFAFGIERLTTEKAYSAAYPLHDVSFFYIKHSSFIYIFEYI
jgi:anoctamin-1